MFKYRIQLTLRPYSGVERAPAKYHNESEQAMRGAKTPSIVIEADGFRDALRLADAIRLGAQLDERLWRVETSAIVQVEEDARKTELMTECAYS